MFISENVILNSVTEQKVKSILKGDLTYNEMKQQLDKLLGNKACLFNIVPNLRECNFKLMSKFTDRVYKYGKYIPIKDVKKAITRTIEKYTTICNIDLKEFVIPIQLSNNECLIYINLDSFKFKKLNVKYNNKYLIKDDIYPIYDEHMDLVGFTKIIDEKHMQLNFTKPVKYIKYRIHTNAHHKYITI